MLSGIVAESGMVKYSEHFDDGLSLFQAAEQNGLEGIIAKRRKSCYVPKRSREWLKMKITRRQECVICGYRSARRA